MKMLILIPIALAALVAPAVILANAPASIRDATLAAKPRDDLDPREVQIEDDGCSSVLLTLAARGAETDDALRARARAAAAAWRKINGGCRIELIVESVRSEKAKRLATWSAVYRRAAD